MRDKRAFCISLIISGIFAVFAGVGYSVDRYGELRLLAAGFAFFLSVWIVGCPVYMLLATGTLNKLHKNIKPVRMSPVAVWLVILASWIPVLMAEFPGFFVYDAVDEYVSVATRTFTTHHPLLHTIMLGGSVYAGEVILGSANLGIFAYITVQMLFISFVFAQAVKDMKSFRLLPTLFYALFPTVVMFALCSVKDTLFAAFLVCAMLQLRRLMGAQEGSGNRKDALCLGISLTLAMLMRHNGIYACAIFALAVCIKNAKVKCRYALILTIVISMAVSVCINKGLEYATGADVSSVEHQEILTVPIQQIARTWSVNPDTWTSEELVNLYGYIPEEALKHYTPKLSDPVKISFGNETYEEDRSGFWRLWLKGLKAHPLSYINAWLNTSYGYWYPFTVVDVYRGHTVYTFTYDESSYFGYETEYPGVRHSFIPAIDSVYRWLSLDDDIHRIPVIRLFFSMGAYFWLLMMGLGIFIYRKNYDRFLVWLLPAAYMLTLLAGPTFLPRYTVFLFFLAPLLIDDILNTDLTSDRKS